MRRQLGSRSSGLVRQSAFRMPRSAIFLLGCLLGDATALAGAAEDYIDAQLSVVRGLEPRLDEMAEIADLAAARLLTGGHLYLAGEPGMKAELNGRAGGLCGAKLYGLDPRRATADDVILFGRYWPTRKPTAPDWADLAATGAMLVLVTPGQAVLRAVPPKNVWVIPVVGAPAGHVPRVESSEPTALPAKTRAYAQAIAIAEWTFVAELIGACRRHRKQLAVYLSIHLDDGQERFKRTQGLLFEPDLKPEPVPRGQYAREFLGHVRAALEAVKRDEAPKIRQAAGWIREARAAGRKVVRHLYGHLPPTEAGLPGDPTFFTDTVTGPVGEQGAEWIRKNLRKGDVYLLVGYQQSEDAMAAAANALGARTIFITSLPPGPEQAKSPLHLYVNPHWPLTDACLDLPGYDVKACPLSGIMSLTCYYAICAEALAGQ